MIRRLLSALRSLWHRATTPRPPAPPKTADQAEIERFAMRYRRHLAQIERRKREHRS